MRPSLRSRPEVPATPPRDYSQVPLDQWPVAELHKEATRLNNILENKKAELAYVQAAITLYYRRKNS